jgi:hypothetical protein
VIPVADSATSIRTKLAKMPDSDPLKADLAAASKEFGEIERIWTEKDEDDPELAALIEKEIVRVLSRNPICLDCGVDTNAIHEIYMLGDKVWRTANVGEAEMLCVGCCERRLGRRLRRADFRSYMIVALERGVMTFSERLRDRMLK